MDEISEDETRSHLASVRAAVAHHIPDTALFVAEVVLVATTLRVAAQIVESSELDGLGRLLPFAVFLKLLGFSLPTYRDAPATPLLIGLVAGVAITSFALWATTQATTATLLQLDSPRLAALFAERIELKREGASNFKKGITLGCFDEDGPPLAAQAKCKRINNFFQKHPLVVQGDVE